MRLSPSLRKSILLSLAVLAIALTGMEIARDRAASFRNLEESSIDRAVALSRIVAPTLGRDLDEGNAPAAEEQVARLRLMPDLVLALVCDADDRVVHATDEKLRDLELNAARPAAASLVGRVRTSLVAQWEIARDGATLRVAAPTLVEALPGELHPSRVLVLYTETDLAQVKAKALAEIVERAALVGVPLLLACLLVWRATARGSPVGSTGRFS